MYWTRIKNRLVSRAISFSPTLAKLFVKSYTPWESEDIPWSDFRKKLNECTVAIVTTAGVHHRDQKPFNMIDKNGDPSYRLINAEKSDLTITHDYYDHRDADEDINIIFPLERLREFEREGIIGSLAKVHYGFMGHITGPHIRTLVNKTAPEAARQLKHDKVDVVLLTPG